MFDSVVEEHFVQIAGRSPSQLGRCDEEHRVCLKTASFGVVKCSDACVFCLIRFPEHTLPCQHRLCRFCVPLCGCEMVPWRVKVSTCPICQADNETTIHIRLPTAGLRVLSLSGRQYESTWQFLPAIWKAVHFTSTCVWEYF